MTSNYKLPISVQDFAKSVGSSDTHIYSLIHSGVIKIIERGAKMFVNPITNRPRYYHYKTLSSNDPTFKVDGVVLKEIDKLCDTGAEYAITSPESTTRDDNRRKLGLPTTLEDNKTVGRGNSKIPKQHPLTTVENQISEMAQSKLRKEQAMAKKAELDCAEREGRLISREDILNLWRDIGIKVQQAILSIPDRVAPVLAGETDSHKIHRMMTEELKFALRNLSFDLKGLKEADDGN